MKQYFLTLLTLLATLSLSAQDGTNATDGRTPSTPRRHEATPPKATAGEVVINELMPANVDMYVDPSWNYGGFVELYNPSDKDVSVGAYWLSDDPYDLKKARISMSVGTIPAKGYRVLWFDHADTRKDVGEGWENTQVDMKLNCDGGTLYLSDDQGNLLLSQDYPQAFMRCSYARTQDAGEQWQWTAAPTPEARNSSTTYATQQLPPPVVNKAGQVFSSPFTLRVTIPTGATLRYTTDGSTPTLTQGSTSHTGIFTVNYTSTYRFRLFQTGYLPSQVVTRSYLKKDRDYYLPIVSIVTDQKNFYDDEIGIYVSGTNGKTANQDYTKRNFNMEWERPASFEYILPEAYDGSNQDGYFAQEADVAINGGWSRKYEPRSLKLKASKVYNLQNSFDFPFFSDKPYHKHKSLLLRNGGNDEYNQTRLKDAALQEIARVSEFPLNLQSYQPTHVFVNGTYFGMLNLREPSNKHYAYSNYGIDTDEVDAFEMSVDSGYVQKEGDKQAFREWYTLSAQAADEMVYQQILERVDIDNYINYMAFKFFLNDWDWPHNNVKGFRDRNSGKFQFVIFDTDNCVDRKGNNIFNDFANKRWNNFYGRPEYGGTSLYLEVEMVTIFLNMLKNAQFRKQFIDTYCLVGGSVFHNEQEITNTVNQIASRIETALGWEGHTPWGSGRSFAGGVIRAVTGTFRNEMISMLQNYSNFYLTYLTRQQVSLRSDVQGAALTLNGLPIPRAQFDGYLFRPITLAATPPAGYRFAGWYAHSGNAGTQTLIDLQSGWTYYDAGSLDDTNWTSPTYIENSWKQGNAPLGYGNSDKPMALAATTLNKTNAQGERVPTCYLRKTFTLNRAPAEGDVFTLRYAVDDGMIAYVNGTEVGLYHMWSGARYAETCQSRGEGSWYEGDNPYEGTLVIPAHLLHKGTNVLAVELHNCNDTSSDMWWEASLERVSTGGTERVLVSEDPSYTLPRTGNYALTASFEPLSADELTAQQLPPVRINEVSAGNTVDVNDYYKKDDWIELYNTTDAPINVAGMYLTDKQSVPHKYQIPALANTQATTIPAHGYLIVWCSKRDLKRDVLHANFKLSNEDGEMVRLEAADGSWADSLYYCAHTGTQSVGRFPDGASALYLMDRTTTQAANRINTYSRAWEYIDPNAPSTGLASLDDAGHAPLQLTYQAQQLVATSATAQRAQLYLYALNGTLIREQAVSLWQGTTTLSLTTLPAGTYVARLRDAEGHEASCKFILP